MSALGCSLVLALLTLRGTVSLKCYKCSNAQNKEECKSMETCTGGQVCYKRREFTNQVQYDLGCIDKQKCGEYASSQNTSDISNMSADRTGYCYECCSKDKCNQELCEYPPVHGGWSTWGDWGKCSATCGVGMRSRKRSCTNPLPKRFGDHCFGDSTEYKLCNSGFCAGVWSDWKPWGKCSEECGQGIQIWKRTCKKDLFTDNCKGKDKVKKTCRGKCYTDCYDIRKNSDKKSSGVYNVTLWKTKKMIPVYCDFDTDNGGWTVFQYRFNGSVDFYRNFTEYKNGFGSLNGEFWLGLEYIYEMVSQGKSELRLDLTADNGNKYFETFQDFKLDQGPRYTLRIGKGAGTTGSPPALTYNNGYAFSTYDHDQDDHYVNCAFVGHGAWWYNKCTYMNLNSKYGVKGTGGMTYRSSSLKSSRMMFRRI